MPVTAAETAAYLRHRRASQAAAIATRRAFVEAKLPQVAELLRARFGATRIWLFGSYVVGTLHPDSDVDLAVEGVPATGIDRAHAEIEAILDGVVDLVDFGSAPTSLRSRMEAEGRSL